MLVCPSCRSFKYARELEAAALRARQLTAAGQLQAARDQWLAALRLLPPGSAQHRGIQREIDKLNRRLSPSPNSWTKRLGPLGVLLAALAKFKTAAFLLLAKAKFLISILAFIGVYWSLFGWWFAVGLTGSVLLHEMGHYLMVRRFGFNAQLPMFLPGFGAYVKWNGANVDPGIRAQISLAGPLFGFFSGLMAYGIFLSTHQTVWLAVAQFAGWINLLNLIPAFIFDGASAMYALGKQARWAVLLVSVALGLVLREYVFLFVGLGAAYRIWKRDFPAEPKEGIAYYFIALIVANGFLSWYCLNQARLLFPHRGF
ncbi:MAG: site-2 protease family protein [Acidobacteriaceae bacterium]|nr:site-2 protease family protein [Acidobacteriaceae bacterium]